MPRSIGGRRRVYSDKFKASAVLMVEAAGYPDDEYALKRVSKEQHIPLETLKGWVKRGIKYGKVDEATQKDIDELMEETRTELTELFENSVRAALREMATKIEDASYRDLAWVAAVHTDKLNVLNGKPTQNIQQGITFERKGITTLPEHPTPGTVNGTGAEETL